MKCKKYKLTVNELIVYAIGGKYETIYKDDVFLADAVLEDFFSYIYFKYSFEEDLQFWIGVDVFKKLFKEVE